MSLVVLALLITCQFLIGLLVFLQSQQTKRIEQRVFSLIAFLTVLWSGFNGVLLTVDTANPDAERFFTLVNQSAFLLAGLVLAFIYLFSLFYPVRKKLSSFHKLFFAAGLLLGIAAFHPYIAGSFAVVEGKLSYQYGAFVGVLTLYAVPVVIGMYTNLWKILHANGRNERLHKQAVNLSLGIALTIAHALLFIVVLPGIFGQNTLLYAIGYAAPLYLIASAGYGLLWQGLFDIRLIIARSIAYLVVLTVVSSIFIGATLLSTNYLLDAPIQRSNLLVLVLVTFAVSLLFQPLKVYFNKLTNRLFYRDYYDPQDVLDRLGNLLLGTVEVEEIKAQSQSMLQDTVHPTFATFLLQADSKGDDKVLLGHLLDTSANILAVDELSQDSHAGLYKLLRKRDAVLAIRLRTTHGDLGFLLLGARRSGEGYAAGEYRLLGLVADELAIGLQNALRFEEIERFNVTLQERIDEATRKLRRTNDKLRLLDQTKDDFISMASHQLRTPLTSVKGYVSMVLDGDAGKITPLQRKLLNQSFVSAQRMVYLISDLLNVSRLRTGKFVIEPIRTNLAAVIEGEISQLVETATSRNLKLIYNKPEHFPTYMLDETKIRQVIMNFVDNAIYYTPAGGTITVHLVEKPQSVEFTVTDTGMGVPKRDQPHLFTKFFRAYNAKRARPDGTGLGLFMAKKVVIAQGGAIIFKSQEGKGSTFGFTFAKSQLQPALAATPAHGG